MLPNTTTVLGDGQRAVESTQPWLSDAGAAVASKSPNASSPEHAATAAGNSDARSRMDNIDLHNITSGRKEAILIPRKTKLLGA